MEHKFAECIFKQKRKYLGKRRYRLKAGLFSRPVACTIICNTTDILEGYKCQISKLQIEFENSFHEIETGHWMEKYVTNGGPLKELLTSFASYGILCAERERILDDMSRKYTCFHYEKAKDKGLYVIQLLDEAGGGEVFHSQWKIIYSTRLHRLVADFGFYFPAGVVFIEDIERFLKELAKTGDHSARARIIRRFWSMIALRLTEPESLPTKRRMTGKELSKVEQKLKMRRNKNGNVGNQRMVGANER